MNQCILTSGLLWRLLLSGVVLLVLYYKYVAMLLIESLS